MNKNRTRINGSHANDNKSLRDNIRSSQSSIAIELPFPPTVNLFDLVSKKSPDGRIPARSPNAFIIYRKVYVETARKSGHFLPMTNISSMASQSWADESEEVRAEYQKIAKDALKVRNEVYPKSSKRKRKDRWNLVSFETPAPDSRNVERQKKAQRKAQRQAVKTSAKTSSLQGVLSPSTNLPSLDMSTSDSTFYDALIVNTNFSANDTTLLNDQNVNNIPTPDNDSNTDNNDNLNIPLSTFMPNETSLQEIVRQLDQTQSSSLSNSGSNFKYDDGLIFNSNIKSNANNAPQISTNVHNARTHVNSLATLYIPHLNILNMNSTNLTSSYASTDNVNHILNDNNMITPSNSPNISFSEDNIIHYYPPPVHNTNFTQLNSVEYSLNKDQNISQ